MKPILTFIIFCLLGAGLMWIGGFNFNQRNPDVAFGCFMILAVATGAAVIVKVDAS